MELTSISSIEDFIGFLGNRVKLSVISIPWNNGYKGRNEFFYREFVHSQSRTSNRKIFRHIRSFVLMKYIPPENNRDVDIRVLLRSEDLESMRMILIPSFEKLLINYDNIFEKRKGKLYVNNANEYTTSITVGLKHPTVLTFKPSVFVSYTDEISPCIDMYFNDTEYKTSISFDNIMGFIRLVRLMDLPSYSMQVVASLPSIELNTLLESSYESSLDRESIFNQRGVNNIYQLNNK